MDQGGIGYLLDTYQFSAFGEVDFYCIEGRVEQEWQVPVGVTSISAVLIAGGGSGECGGNQRQSRGGGGGGLRWINFMPVQPGEILKICVGCGGTAVLGSYAETLPPAQQPAAGYPGEDSYISSTNNANVPGRTGIGDTIIVFAGGGSKTQSSFVDGSGRTRNIYNGGTGSTTGNFDWGTIGGGNGGFGGPSSNKGGARDGGGGGAGGFSGNGGNGAYAGAQGSDADVDPTPGSGGGGGGGMYTSGGGGNGGGGGGGTGVIWGQGPNGDDAQNGTPVTANQFYSWPGQGGSYGADGLATGNQTFTSTDYNNALGLGALPQAFNYNNKSIGNGVRGYIGEEDDELNRPTRESGGGYFGGGGGGADTSGSELANSGSGGDGVVRIIYAARFNRERNYPSPNNATNPLSNYGYPFDPPAEGGPRLDGNPNVVGSSLPYPNSTSQSY